LELTEICLPLFTKLPRGGLLGNSVGIGRAGAVRLRLFDFSTGILRASP
jgi:hypothetical protein